MSTFRLISRRTSILLTLGLIVGIGAFAYLHRDDLDRESILAFGQGLPAPLFVTAFLLLPLVGFPISILLVLAGIRFGLAGGMAVATVGVFFHNFAAYRMTHSWFRQRLRDRLEQAGHGIPPIKSKHQVWFTAVFTAIHGPPYSAKLYALALTDISFRVYFWVGSPVYILFCLVPVGAGSAVSDFNLELVAWIVTLSAALLAAGFVLRKKFGGSINA